MQPRVRSAQQFTARYFFFFFVHLLPLDSFSHCVAIYMNFFFIRYYILSILEGRARENERDRVG